MRRRMCCLCDVNERSRVDGGNNSMAGVLDKMGTRALTNIHAKFIRNSSDDYTTLSNCNWAAADIDIRRDL